MTSSKARTTSLCILLYNKWNMLQAIACNGANSLEEGSVEITLVVDDQVFALFDCRGRS